MPEQPPLTTAPRELSLVVPVYQGEHTLEALAREVAPLTTPQQTPGGRSFKVLELLLVHDCGRDDSVRVIREVCERFPFVRPIWLSRNFGQHPATLAGMASSVGAWVGTLDEDGQQDPRDFGALLDAALDRRARLVYARPQNPPPHGAVRNAASRTAKWIFVHLLGAQIGPFNSFRLIEGEVARGVAAYAGANVYLDVALSWVVADSAQCPVFLREERGRPSGYTFKRLVRHFWQLVLSSGTRPLRLISVLGAAAVVFAVGYSLFQVWQRLSNKIPVQGWTSTIILLTLFGGLALVSLGVLAEYLAFAVSMAMGKPAYLIVSRPREELDIKP